MRVEYDSMDLSRLRDVFMEKEVGDKEMKDSFKSEEIAVEKK